MKLLLWVALLLAVCLASPVWAQDVAPSVLEAINAYNRGDAATAYRLLKPAADAGDSDAQVNLGYLYARGQVVEQDQAEAMRLYMLSAEQGNPEGMNAVGFKHRYGTGVPVNLRRAMHWFCRAAVSGDPRGLNNLAIMYYEGKGVDREVDEARNLWRQSAERGNPNAMFNLGQSLYFDEPSNRELATTLFLQAGERGHAGAQQHMRRLGYRDAFPPAVVDPQAEMRPAQKNQPSGKVRDCGFFVS